MHDVRHLGPIREEPARLGQIAGADLDVVASLGQVDADGLRSNVLTCMLLKPSRSAGVTVILRNEADVKADVFQFGGLGRLGVQAAAIRSRSARRLAGPGQLVSGQTVCCSTTSASR